MTSGGLRIWLSAARELWRHEELDFTPWLLANADQLATAIGLDLELHQAEYRVGSFSLDLIGSDRTHDCVLIVENQQGRGSRVAATVDGTVGDAERRTENIAWCTCQVVVLSDAACQCAS